MRVLKAPAIGGICYVRPAVRMLFQEYLERDMDDWENQVGVGPYKFLPASMAYGGEWWGAERNAARTRQDLYEAHETIF